MSFRKTYKSLITLMIISFVFVSHCFSQASISGIVNQYAKCISLFQISNSAVVDNALPFHKNDTVLIIQMKGAVINLSNNNNFGTVSNLNNTGSFEFNMIDSVNLLTNTLYFKCTFLNIYTGPTQVVRIPTYTNAQVNGVLTAKAWDGSSGGVLALIDHGQLKLNADIDVSGKGFRGASPTFNPNPLCATTAIGFLRYSYTNNAVDSAGLKGEGIAEQNLFFSRGRGNYATGGGGGHTYDAAGGGGSGYGDGGKGGTNADTCTYINDLGGIGGVALNSLVSGQFKLFLGGGGGAGLYESNSLNDATPGGNGGGIVIIAADLGIIGNNKNIIANGKNVTGVTANESAGGGGGGGCVVIISQNVSSLATIQAKGGNGGTTALSCRGSGGGGGGGFIAIPPTISTSICSIEGGFQGGVNNTGICTAWTGTHGNNGHLVNNFTLPLPPCFSVLSIINNFISGNQNICQNTIPATINGTIPQGGNGTYTYYWEQSPDGINWTSITGANSSSYSFSAPLTQTTHFRRIVTSGIETDVSNEIIITVVILNVNTAFSPASCFGLCNGTANAIVSGVSGLQYNWSNGLTSSSITGLCASVYTVTVTEPISGCTATSSVTISQPPLFTISITSISNPVCHNTPNGKILVNISGGNPPHTILWSTGQTSTTLNNILPGNYSVTITDSYGCMETASVILPALTTISNNIIDSYKIVCGTDTAFPIVGNIPNGVDTTVSYLWIQSTDTIANIWSVAPISPGGITGRNYIPFNPGPSPKFYSRIAFYNGCMDTSNICKVSVYPGSSSLGNNVIGSPLNQIVNFSQTPATIHGNIITGGIPGDTLQFLWIKSLNTQFDPMWPATEGTFEDTNLVFSEGADTSFYYNRFAYYLLVPEMKLACISYSNIGRVLLLDSNNISCADTVLCSGTLPSVITGNTGVSYTYQWQTYNGTIWVDISGATLFNLSLTSLSVTTSFRRIVVIGGTNTLISNIITIHITPPVNNNAIWTGPPNNISNNIVYVCPGTVVQMGNISGPTGGNGTYTYQWLLSNNNTNWVSAPFPFGIAAGYQTDAVWDTIYVRRQVTSGSCVSLSNIITINPVAIPAANNISIPTDHICSGSNADIISETVNTQGLGLNYAWEKRPVSSGIWEVIPSETNYNFQPTGLTETTAFHRIVTNNQATPVCSSVSNDITVYVNTSPSYTLLVPAAYDTVLSGTNTILNVSLIGTPPYNISVFDGNQLYSYVVNGNSQSITLTPFQNPTTYTLTSISDASGCPYSGVSQSVTIYTYINSTVYAGTDTAICGLVGTLNATPSVSGINWWTGPSWVTFSDTTSPTSQITSTLYLNAQIWWHEQNGSFHNSASIHVKFDEMVSPPDAGVDITLLGLSSVSLNAGIPVPALSTGLWSVIAGNAVFNNTGDSHTQVSSLLNGENILVWTVRNGACGPLSDTMSIFVKDMIIPEGFSPNNDGKNDYFEITGIETFDKSELIVFNRWGHMVYQKSNYDNSWNGKGLNDKPLAEDTYFYLLTLNNKETKKGFIVLKR